MRPCIVHTTDTQTVHTTDTIDSDAIFGVNNSLLANLKADSFSAPTPGEGAWD